MTVTNAPAHVLKAKYQPNQETPEHEAPSVLVHTLRHFAWVPSAEGGFHKPEDMTREALPEDFPYDNRNGWLDAVEFGKAYRLRLEQAAHANFERIKAAMSANRKLRNWDYQLSLWINSTSFPLSFGTRP